MDIENTGVWKNKGSEVSWLQIISVFQAKIHLYFSTCHGKLLVGFKQNNAIFMPFFALLHFTLKRYSGYLKKSELYGTEKKAQRLARLI